MASKLLISIDLGAQNTGVLLAEEVAAESTNGTVAAGVANSTGVLLRLAPRQQQWSQVPRRGARHLSRCGRRRKLAKRLLREILLDKTTAAIPPPAAKFINGLCNRRGFTYHAEELEKLEEYAGFDESGDTILHALADDFFPTGRTILESLQRLLADVEKVLALPLFKNSLYNKSKLNEKHEMYAQADEFLKKCDEKSLQTLQKNMYNKVCQILESMKMKDDGHLPRAKYLDNIRADIATENELGGDFAAVLQGADFSAAQFADIVGHVSNLPWRVLHNYFNDTARAATANAWNNERLLKLINKEVQEWRCDKKDEAAQKNRADYLSALTAAEVLLAWASVAPEKTVPPFESRNNHNPPKCMSLLIATERLNDDALRRVTAAFLAADENLNGQLTIHKKSRLARILQRVLDCSRAHDKYNLRDLANGRAGELQREKLAKFLAARGAKIGDMAVFLEFAKQYYDESAQGAHGTWAAGGDSLLRRCGINPPHKAKIKDVLIARVLGCDPQEVRDIEKFMRDNKAGKKGLWAICKEAAALQKKHGSVIMKSLHDAAADDKDGKEVQKSYGYAEKAAQEIAEHLGHDETQWRCYANPFSMAQLFRHLDGVAGFSSTCRDCSKDNAWRMQMSAAADETLAAQAKALPSDSVRPFDGMLLRILVAQAEAIARLQMDKLAQDDEAPRQITICLEQNAFSFSMGLDDIKKVKNEKRKKAQEKRLSAAEQAATDKAERLCAQKICPYTGQTITRRNLDHIIPRAACRRWGGSAAFNSEANLIGCSAAGNTQKAERLYELCDLHPDYLRAVFQTADINKITSRIKVGVRQLLDNSIKYTSFADLIKQDEESALCLRHALFVDDLREKVTAKILNTERKARVNGTQRFLAKRIWQALDRQFAQRNWQRPARRLFRVEAGEVSMARRLWLGAEWEKPKNETQGAASHVADAAVVCALACNVEAWDDDFMPKSVHIKHLEKRKPWQRARAGHYKIFSGTIYGERFLPLLVNAAGECRIGFADDNSVLIKKPERWLQALRPFLYEGKSPLADVSVLQLQERARAGQAVRLHVHKQTAMQALLEDWQAVQNGDARAAEAAEFLRILHYTTLRQDIKEAVDEAKKGKFKLWDGMFKQNNIVKIEHKTLENGKVCLPIYKKWQRLHDILSPYFCDKSAKNWDEAWSKIEDELFPKRPQHNGKLHHRRHLAMSLPQLATPSGAWRIRRKTADGGHVFQLLAVDKFGARGFAEKESGAVDFKHAVPLAELLKSRWLAPAKDLQQPPDKVVDFDKWEEVDKPAASAVRRLWVALGSQSRGQVRVEVSVDDLLKIAQAANSDCDDWRKIPAEIKTKDISKTVLEVLALGTKPRDKILVRYIGEEVAQIEFVAESKKPHEWFNAKRTKNGE